MVGCESGEAVKTEWQPLYFSNRGEVLAMWRENFGPKDETILAGIFFLLWKKTKKHSLTLYKVLKKKSELQLIEEQDQTTNHNMDD